MEKKPTIPDFPTLPDFGQMITQACEVVASVRGIPYDFNGTLSLENKFVVLFKTVKKMFDAQDELVKSYKDLYNFINTYFTNLDVQKEINSKLDNMSKTGELSTLLKNFVKINQPILVNNKENMVDTSALYILASDGFVYYYNGSTFVASSMKYNAPINAYENHSHSIKFNIDDIKSIGSFTVNPNSLIGLVLENVNDYYWSCYCITPVVDNNTDVIQYLIGLPLENTDKPPAFYYRYSLLGDFTKFNKILQNKISKKVCFCGDSFTYVSFVKSYVAFLNEYGCCEGVNYGIPGSNPETWLEKHENDIIDGYDVYFIAFGLNGLDIPNGNFNDNTNDTYCGQMNILIDKIYNKCPTARIIIWCMDGWFPEARSNAFKQVADYKGCEFYSMKADKNIPVRLNGKFTNVLPNLSPDIVNLKNKALKLSDDHPNEKAQKMLANYLMHII